MSETSEQELKRLVKLALQNLNDHAQLKTKLSAEGINPAAEATRGQQLYNAFQTATDSRDKLEGAIKDLQQQVRTLLAQAWPTFTQHRERADVAIKLPSLLELIPINDPLQRTRKHRLPQMLDFYSRLLAQPDALALMETVSVPREELEENYAEAQRMERLENEIVITKGRKLQGTKDKTAALKALRRWHERLLQRAELATEDQPDLLESLKG